MAYVTAQARQELLDTVAEAIDHIGQALGLLGDVYEALDDDSADRLEDELFRPVQHAYGRAKRTHSEFAERVGLPVKAFPAPATDTAPRDARDALERVVDAVELADDVLSELQDSMSPVEVGDPELRAGLAEVRRLLGDLTAGARRFVRVLGR